MQDFAEVADVEEAEADAERLLRGQFSLEDFLTQLKTLQKMGPLKDVMAKLPFAGDLIPEGAEIDSREFGRIEAMILSMTPQERRRPELIDASRRERIARGSGTPGTQVSSMLKRFGAMKQMMSQLGAGGMGGLLGRIPGVGRLLGGGAPDLSGVDPSLLASAGGNRRATRAMKAQQRKQKRKQMRKHKRKGR